MGWTSLNDGKLVKVAIESGFDIMITVDKNLQYQKNLKECDIFIRCL